MIKWREAYERLKGTPEFASYFGGKVMPIGAFRFLAYSLRFEGVAGSAVAGTFGPTSGPTLQPFPSGAVVLGITASGYSVQQEVASYAPSFNPGRRDLFGISLQYTNDEQITPNGLTIAEALLGSGYDTLFPGKELLIPPSQGILTAVALLTPATLPSMSIHVVFHTMVPRAAG